MDVFWPLSVIIQPSVTPTVSSSSQMHQALGVKTTKCLSILLVICGVLMMIIQIACTVIVEEKSGLWGAHYGGSGIWCGFFIMLSGIIGCCAASKKSNGLVRNRHVTYTTWLIQGRPDFEFMNELHWIGLSFEISLIDPDNANVLCWIPWLAISKSLLTKAI